MYLSSSRMGQPVLEPGSRFAGSNVVRFRNRTRFSIGAEQSTGSADNLQAMVNLNKLTPNNNQVARVCLVRGFIQWIHPALIIQFHGFTIIYNIQ